MKEPLVSIVIANYNYAHLVGDAIESALGQTYKNKEIVVLDNGSTDNSLEVIEQYPVFSLVQDQNGGKIGAAWNAVVAASTGEYLVILSADDMLCPLHLEMTVPVLNAAIPSTGWVNTWVNVFGERVGVWQTAPFHFPLLKVGNCISCSSLMRRSMWDEVGGYRDISYGDAFVSHDWDFWLRAAHKGYKGALVPIPLLNYRVHSDSLMETHQMGPEMQAAIRKANPEIYGGER